ncbi:MAG: DUF302 domain-containing protein [Gammaproteobacteria bacterium]|nr:DUF302 domain-containing protein [Gammaproteobacteria bacterium]
MRKYIVLVLLLCSGILQAAPDRDSYMRMYVVNNSYEFVRDDLELAITGRGIKINNISHIGAMLARTGKDVGAKKKVFEHAEAFEFCSATVSRATMEADPHNIVFCPYIIAVYSLPGEKNKTYLSFRRPTLVGDKASRTSLQKVEDLMKSIVEEVAQ